MGAAAPEKQGFRQGFDISKYGRPSSGEAADTLEPGVHYGERAAPEGIWQHSENEGKEPGESDYHISFAEAQQRRLTDEDERENPDYEGEQETDRKRTEGGVGGIEKGDQHREKHEKRIYQKRIPHVPADSAPIHCACVFLPRRAEMRLRSWRFSTVTSRMEEFNWWSSSSPVKSKLYCAPVLRYMLRPSSIL